MTIKALLVAIDSLVGNMSHLNFRAWDQVLQSYGYTLTYEEYLEFFLLQFGSHVLVNLFPFNTREEHAEIVKKKVAVFVEMISELDREDIHLTDGILEFLLDVSQHEKQVVIAAVTDLSVEETKALLDAVKLNDLLHVICSGYGLKRCKPDPLIYGVALSQIGVPPSDVCVFEGTSEGCMAARYANIANVIGVKPFMPTSVENREEHAQDEVMAMMNQGAKCVISSLRDFEFDWIEGMMTRRSSDSATEIDSSYDSNNHNNENRTNDQDNDHVDPGERERVQENGRYRVDVAVGDSTIFDDVI